MGLCSFCDTDIPHNSYHRSSIINGQMMSVSVAKVMQSKYSQFSEWYSAKQLVFFITFSIDQGTMTENLVVSVTTFPKRSLLEILLPGIECNKADNSDILNEPAADTSYKY